MSGWEGTPSNCTSTQAFPYRLSSRSILSQGNDTWHWHIQAHRPNKDVGMYIYHNRLARQYRLDGVLPTPERQRIVAQRAEVRVEDQGRTGFRRNRHELQVHLSDRILESLLYLVWQSCEDPSSRRGHVPKATIMPPQKQCRCRAIWTPSLPQFCHPAE